MKTRFFWTLVVVALSVTLILANIGTASPALPVIAINPKVNSAVPTKTFTFNITISGVTLENTKGFGICAWEVDISFNSTVLNVFSVKEGPWLKQAGTTYWIPPQIDNTAGTIVASASLFPIPVPPKTGATGSGTLANITFTVLTRGVTPLHFYKTLLRAYNATSSSYLTIEHTVVDGYYQYPLGDLDGDGYVGPIDLNKFAAAYGKRTGQTGYNLWADLDKDDYIGPIDLNMFAANYGKRA